MAGQEVETRKLLRSLGASLPGVHDTAAKIKETLTQEELMSESGNLHILNTA